MASQSSSIARDLKLLAVMPSILQLCIVRRPSATVTTDHKSGEFVSCCHGLRALAVRQTLLTYSNIHHIPVVLPLTEFPQFLCIERRDLTGATHYVLPSFSVGRRILTLASGKLAGSVARCPDYIAEHN